MAFTETEELRIQAIETKLNEIQTALLAVASKSQMKALLMVRQSEIEQLKEDVASLQTQIQVLQAL